MNPKIRVRLPLGEPGGLRGTAVLPSTAGVETIDHLHHPDTVGRLLAADLAADLPAEVRRLTSEVRSRSPRRERVRPGLRVAESEPPPSLEMTTTTTMNPMSHFRRRFVTANSSAILVRSSYSVGGGSAADAS
jgi:hypothetical protein